MTNRKDLPGDSSGAAVRPWACNGPLGEAALMRHALSLVASAVGKGDGVGGMFMSCGLLRILGAMDFRRPDLREQVGITDRRYGLRRYHSCAVSAARESRPNTAEY